MTEVLYEYAKNNNNEFVHISKADKLDFYFLESEHNGKVQMIPVQGDILQWHFRSKVKGEPIKMTAEHINLQAKICNDLFFYCKDLDVTVTAKSAKSEYRLSNNRIVDIAYFDDNNDFLCGIEVVHSNDINNEKYIDLYNSDYFIFKVYTYAKERFIFIANNKINKDKNRILEQIRIIESRHPNSRGNYFDRGKFVKSKFRESKNEEAKLIRDIEQITEKINKIITP